MPELPHNAKPSQATPLGHLKAWRLTVKCGKCRKRTMIPLDYLALQYGQNTTVWQAIERLRCRGRAHADHCGGKPSHVVLAQLHVHGKSVRTVQEIVVWPLSAA